MKAQCLNHARIIFDSRSVNENFARTAVTGFIAALDPTISDLTDIKTAVSEAVTNCIVHAYPDTAGKVVMDLSVYEGGLLRIVVTDRGCGISNVAQAMTPLFTTGADGERSGLGFSVMESFMDTLRVSSRVGKGTRVTMTKKLQGKNVHT